MAAMTHDHGHDHGHGHEHGQAHDHDQPPGPMLEDAVLDIGGDIGALILTTDPELEGREVEVSPVDPTGARIHTVIHERRIGDRVVFAGIFVELRAGTYRIWTDRPGLVDRVTIVGGEVAEVDWTIPAGDDRG